MSDYIKKLAEQAGMEWDTHIWCWLANPPHLKKFAELVRQDEREICAKIALKYEPTERQPYVTYAADEIRARGNHG
jgi:hypothetical protein